MPKRKGRIKRILFIVVLIILAWLTWMCNRSFPIITGYCAKAMCTEVFLCGRAPADINAVDLSFFPVSMGTCVVNRHDSTVTSTILGHWAQTAVFRQGLGATLIHGITADSLRRQPFRAGKIAVADRDTVDWPLGDNVKGNARTVGVDSQKLLIAVNDFFAEPEQGRKKNTRALLVVYKGAIIAERYAAGFNRQSRFLGWSMGKSVGGALIGLLQRQHRLDITQPAALHAWNNALGDIRSAITVRDILQQATGLAFNENYATLSDVTRMLYLEPDMGNYTASRPLARKPGSYFEYSSGNANLLSLKMRELLGDSAYHRFPYDALFHPLGMEHTLFEMDQSGSFITSSYVYASARDWARFGLLYLRKGFANGQQLLDSTWVTASFQPAHTGNFNRYGYQFWLNRGNDSADTYRAFPHVPADMAYAGGFQGQAVFIIPSEELVVVRLGMSAATDYGADRSLQLLIEALH